MTHSQGKRYIIGDIHGDYGRLMRLMDRVSAGFHPAKDRFIFLGDYVSYGPDSYKVIDFLINLSQRVKAEFLLGDHDHMFLGYLTQPRDHLSYIEREGGQETLDSYLRETGDKGVPEKHIDFLSRLRLSYEEGEFFCVHAGLNPDRSNIREQKVEDLLNIGEPFYRSRRVWKKLIIFGHTETHKLHSQGVAPFFDGKRNLLGLDTGSGRGGRLSCYEVMTQRFYQS